MGPMLMKVTFSEEELAQIDANRGQEPRATYVKRMALNAPPRVSADAEPARGAGPIQEVPSPALAEQIKASGPEAYGGPMLPPRKTRFVDFSKPPLQRPIVQKREKR